MKELSGAVLRCIPWTSQVASVEGAACLGDHRQEQRIWPEQLQSVSLWQA